jgi:plasmid stabilization system protein ParE
MPRGDKSKYTDKQGRMADHIADGYESRGVSEKEAERRAWATVNKETGGGKKSGSGRGHPVSPVTPRRARAAGSAARRRRRGPPQRVRPRPRRPPRRASATPHMLIASPGLRRRCRYELRWHSGEIDQGSGERLEQFAQRDEIVELRWRMGAP